MRFAARALALLAAVALLADSPAGGASLEAVAAANGHAALAHLRATASGVVEGRRVEVTLDQLGTGRLVRRCTAEVCSGSWFDGSRRWTFGLNEVLLPDDGDPFLAQRRTLAAIASYDFAEPAFRARGGTVTAAGNDSWRVRSPGGATLIARVDSRTLALVRADTERGETIATYDGELRAGRAGLPRRQSGVDAVALDAAVVVPGPIVPPAGPAVRYAGDEGAPLAPDPVPIVPCTLAGVPARCLLDTGADPSAIALPLAERLGLEPRGELEIAAFARFATGFVQAGPLSAGAVRFDAARFAVVPPSNAPGFDVVIGADLLARMHVVLDRAHGIAQIGAPGPRSAGVPSGATAVPLRFWAGTPHVEAVLDGQPQVSALFDSGDQAVISLGYAQYRSGPQWPVVGRGQAVGLANAVEDALVVDIPSVRIGPLAAGTTRATVRRTQADPHVGIGLWDRLVVDLDEGAGRVLFRLR